MPRRARDGAGVPVCPATWPVLRGDLACPRSDLVCLRSDRCCATLTGVSTKLVLVLIT